MIRTLDWILNSVCPVSAREVRPVVEQARHRKARSNILWGSAIGIVCATAVAVGLLVWHSHRTTPPISDAAALAREISSQCSLGINRTDQSEIEAKLEKYFTGLHSGAKVSTSEFGALIDNITPNDQGLSIYRAYTDCLKQQTAALLAKNGIPISPLTSSDISDRRDREVLDEISEIGPQTPKDRLVEIYGSPIASGKDAYSGDYDVDLYQYKHSEYAADYTKDGERVGIALAKSSGESKFSVPAQLKDITLSSILWCDGDMLVSGHSGFVRSGFCPPSHASNYIANIYIFPDLHDFVTENDTSTCKALIWDPKSPKLTACQKLASAQAFAVVMIGDYKNDIRTQRQLTTVANAFLDELDFGYTYTFQ